MRTPTGFCLHVWGAPKAASPLSDGFWSTQSLPTSLYLYRRKINSRRKKNRKRNRRREKRGREYQEEMRAEEGEEVRRCGRTGKDVKERTGGREDRSRGAVVTGTGPLFVRRKCREAPSQQCAPSHSSPSLLLALGVRQGTLGLVIEICTLLG